MPAPRLPAVLFDLDGTLIDSVELIVRSARHAFATCEDYRGRLPSDDEWLVDLGMPLSTMFGRFTTDPDEVERLIEGYREFQLANHDELVSCYTGILEVVAELHELGHPIAIVTSKSVPIAGRGLALVGLERMIETIVGLESVQRHKPDPEPVRVALQRLSVEPHEAVFVGDSPHDMTSGRGAGVVTIAALWGPFTRAQLTTAKPDYFVKSPREILSTVERVAEELEEAGDEE